MAALISVLVAVTLSLLITRIAAKALTLTGMSRASASFQARSAVLVRVPLRLPRLELYLILHAKVESYTQLRF